MLELTLTRHAKSDWGDPQLTDHERPLNARGRRDAPRMARRLAEALITGGATSESGGRAGLPRIFSSTAVRARATAEVFGDELGAEVELDDGLYLASAGTLLKKAVGSGASSVMVVAHDPGISELAWRLSGGGIEHMPTCAVARFTWQQDSWDAAAGTADFWILDTPSIAAGG